MAAADGLAFRTLKRVITLLLRVFFGFEVRNHHQIPSSGSLIITANHFSFLDPVVLQAACPRKIFFIMTEKYYNLAWARWFFRFMHAIPLRENTAYHIGPLKAGLEILREGKVMGIYPEGGISQTGVVQEGKPGTLLLAQKSKARIVPAFISGTHQALPRNARFLRKAKIKVVFGEPITFADLANGAKGRPALEEGTRALIERIRNLSVS